MALVVFLKGINVGGYRRVRPSELAKRLKKYEVVNVGAAGTFVVRKSIGREKLRAALRRHLPFEAEIMICDARDILRLAANDPFAGEPADRATIQFVSVLGKRKPSTNPIPASLPANGEWGLKVLKHDDRFVLGVYRRQMKAIGHLAQLEKLVGAAMTTRSWSTIQTIARILKSEK